MDSMSAIGGIVPWMLTEGVRHTHYQPSSLICCHLVRANICLLLSLVRAVSHLASCLQNHERDSPFTGDNYNNTEADLGGMRHCFTHRQDSQPSLIVVHHLYKTSDILQI